MQRFFSFVVRKVSGLQTDLFVKKERNVLIYIQKEKNRSDELILHFSKK